MNTFSDRSQRRLDSCRNHLRKVFALALQRSAIDFGIAEGARSLETQKTYFLKGVSKINPDAYATEMALLEDAKHIVTNTVKLSRAVDIFAYVPGKKRLTYDERHLCYIAGVVMSCAKELDVKLRWGGNWDRDGEIVTDQTFDDLVHFELD